MAAAAAVAVVGVHRDDSSRWGEGVPPAAAAAATAVVPAGRRAGTA